MLVSFKTSADKNFILEFGHRYIHFYINHGQLLNNTQTDIYEVITPYSESDLEKLSFTQNGDILYIFHPDYPIKTLTHYADQQWYLEDFTLKGGPWNNVNTGDTTLKISATTGEITITASQSLFEETDIGRLVRITVVDSDKTAWQVEKSVTADAIYYSDNKYYRALGTGTTGSVKPVHSEGTQSDGAILFKYVHSGYGTAKITGFTNSTIVTAEVVDEFPSELITSPSTYWELGLIHSGAEYPSCGGFFRGRFCFGISQSGVCKVCFSNSDDYNNFADKEHGEVLDTNAITVPVSSDKYTTLNWLVSSSVLFIGTDLAEFYIDVSSTSQAFSPENAVCKVISQIGSKKIQPVTIGAHTLFIARDGCTIRDIKYSYVEDSYDPVDLSLYGKHLLQSGVCAMTYQENPDKIVWFAVNDGRLIGLTFSSEQNVAAFHQHYLGGAVSDVVTSIGDNDRDELYCVITRTLDGYSLTSIEYMDNGTPYTYPDDISTLTDTDEKETQEAEYMKDNAFYVDGGLSGDFNTVVNGSLYMTSSNLWNNTIYIQPKDGEETGYTVTDATTPVKLDGDTYVDMYFAPKTETVYSYEIGVSDELDGFVYQVYADIYNTSLEEYVTTLVTVGTVKNGKITLNLGTSFFSAMNKVLIRFFGENPSERTITGLSHLEGKEVAVMIDGAEAERQTVTNGSITVKGKFSHCVVGLPVESEYVPQTLYIQGNNGAGVGDVQRIDHITLMLWRTLGGKIGKTFNSLQDIYYRKTDEEMDNSAPLYTGNKEIPVSFSTSTIKEKGAKVLIYNDSVFPMNILAIAPKINVSGNGL